MINIRKKIDISIILKITIVSAIIFLCGIYIISQKENLSIDELYTYGLANNAFQLQIEDFKEYTGKELLYNYTTVKPGHEFDIKNLFFNQTMDTHPPVYYIIVNFICSLFSGKFSIWYGLIINIICLIILYWQMNYLLCKITNDKIISYAIPIISFFTYGFIDEIAFTRSYMLLSIFSLAFIILILNNVNNTKFNINFLIKYFILCILGTLTHYHFILTAIFFSIYFAIKLIKNKNFKLLILTLITGIFSLLISYLIFPAMMNHIFGNTVLHGFGASRVNSIVAKFTEIGASITTAFFGIGIITYTIILLILITLFIIFRKKDFNINKLYILLLIYSLFYYATVCITAQFTFARYLYNIYSILIILIISPIYFITKSFKPTLKYTSIIIMLILTITSTYNSLPASLNFGDSLFEQFLNENKDTKVILLYRTTDEEGNENTMSTTSKWKLPRPLYSLRMMKNLTFVDISDGSILANSKESSVSNYKDFFLVIYTEENDEQMIQRLMQKNDVNRAQKIYFTNYYHMYRLTK